MPCGFFEVKGNSEKVRSKEDFRPGGNQLILKCFSSNARKTSELLIFYLFPLT